MNITILYQIAGSSSSPEFSETSPKGPNTREELDKLKKELATLLQSSETPSDDKIKSIKRRITRLERFDRIQDSATKDKKVIEKILAGKTSETYLGSDLLSLKKRGVDIASLVLIDEKSPDKDIKSGEITTGSIFIVNFGVNKSLNAHIGAGDILPSDINTVRINGNEGTRRDIPRPGYYDKNGRYLPIFDGSKIEIVRQVSLTEEQLKKAQEAREKRWRYLRANDMIDYNDKNPLTDLDEDKSLFSDVTKVAQERSRIKNVYTGGANINTYAPYSEKAKILFRDACKYSNIDESWAELDSIHEILKRESQGKVGVLNYTLPKDLGIDDFKNMAIKKESIGATSSASGLGQLLLSNVDKYYPDGRQGIGNPLSEAVGMLRYIQDRYGHPDIAWNMYGKTGSYQHPYKGVLPKTFKEGY